MSPSGSEAPDISPRVRRPRHLCPYSGFAISSNALMLKWACSLGQMGPSCTGPWLWAVFCCPPVALGCVLLPPGEWGSVPNLTPPPPTEGLAPCPPSKGLTHTPGCSVGEGHGQQENKTSSGPRDTIKAIVRPKI
ncbi:hypothetical protein MHYP_G00169550 [Metynnis hypsauchen]